MAKIKLLMLFVCAVYVVFSYFFLNKNKCKFISQHHCWVFSP